MILPDTRTSAILAVEVGSDVVLAMRDEVRHPGPTFDYRVRTALARAQARKALEAAGWPAGMAEEPAVADVVNDYRTAPLGSPYWRGEA